MNKKSKKTFVLKDALYGLPRIHPKTIKNDRSNENNLSGYNILKIKKLKKNQYIDLINNKKKIEFIYNHKARYNNNRDIEIFKRLLQGQNSTHEIKGLFSLIRAIKVVVVSKQSQLLISS